MPEGQLDKDGNLITEGKGEGEGGDATNTEGNEVPYADQFFASDGTVDEAGLAKIREELNNQHSIIAQTKKQNADLKSQYEQADVQLAVMQEAFKQANVGFGYDDVIWNTSQAKKKDDGTWEGIRVAIPTVAKPKSFRYVPKIAESQEDGSGSPQKSDADAAIATLKERRAARQAASAGGNQQS